MVASCASGLLLLRFVLLVGFGTHGFRTGLSRRLDDQYVPHVQPEPQKGDRALAAEEWERHTNPYLAELSQLVTTLEDTVNTASSKDRDGHLKSLVKKIGHVKDKATEIDLQESRAAHSIDAWFIHHGRQALENWTKDDVQGFLLEEPVEQNVAEMMAEHGADGKTLVEVLETYDVNQARKYGIFDSTHWRDLKLSIRSYLRRAPEPIEEDAQSAKKRCSRFCDSFQLEHTFGYEWALFPKPHPWPNPIHTWICDPIKWHEIEDSPNVTDMNVSDSALRRITKGMKSMLVAMVSKSLGSFVEAGKTLLECSACSLCVLWRKFEQKLAYLEDLLRKAKRKITKSASKAQKNKYYKDFAVGYHAGLLQTFGSNLSHASAAGWQSQVVNSSAAQDLLTDAELAERMDNAERQHNFAVRLLQEAEVATFGKVENQMQSLLAHETIVSKLQPQSSSSSMLQDDGVDPLDVPRECRELLDPRYHLRQYRKAFTWAVNIEMPNLGDAIVSLLSLEFKSALEALVPELLIMVIPKKRAYKKCMKVPHEALSKEALTCSAKHRGMCMLAMKHQLMSEMIEAEWPPLEPPSWFQRRKIVGKLDDSVLDTCLGDDFANLFSRKRHTKQRKAKGGELTKEEETNNADYQDCRLISKRVKEVDFDKDGVALFSPKIWWASMEVWSSLRKQELANADIDNQADQPDLHPFIGQFCFSLLECPAQTNLSWTDFLSSFEEVSASHNIVFQRQVMFEHWYTKIEDDMVEYAFDDRKGILDLEEVYVQRIKPIMSDPVDLSQNPFTAPSAFQPRYVRMWTSDISADALDDPKYPSSIKWHWKDRYIWVEPNLEEGCPKLHMVMACDKECKGCDTSTVEGLLGQSEGCPDVTAPHLASCSSCRKYEFAYIVNCNQQQGASFYSLSHSVYNASSAVDSHGFTKQAVLHLFYHDRALDSARSKSALRVALLEFHDAEGQTRMNWIMELLQTVRYSGQCSCLCESLRDYKERKPCVDTAVPALLGQGKVENMCMPVDWHVPGGICCNQTEVGSLVGPIPALKAYEAYSCAPPGPWELTKRACEKVGMELCPVGLTAGLVKELSANDFAKETSFRGAYNLEVHRKGHTRVGRGAGFDNFRKCINNDWYGDQPQHSTARSAFTDPKFRVWLNHGAHLAPDRNDITSAAFTLLLDSCLAHQRERRVEDEDAGQREGAGEEAK